MNPNWERLWRSAGIQFVVFFVIAFIVFGDQPKVGASADELVSFYDGDRTRILIATVIFGFAVLNLMWFGAALTSASPSPTEIRNANTYFLNRFILFPPQCARLERRKACRDALVRLFFAFSPAGARLSRYELDELVQLVPPKISALPPRFVLAAYR